jgi:hypothetical protein
MRWQAMATSLIKRKNEMKKMTTAFAIIGLAFTLSTMAWGQPAKRGKTGNPETHRSLMKVGDGKLKTPGTNQRNNALEGDPDRPLVVGSIHANTRHQNKTVQSNSVGSAQGETWRNTNARRNSAGFSQPANSGLRLALEDVLIPSYNKPKSNSLITSDGYNKPKSNSLITSDGYNKPKSILLAGTYGRGSFAKARGK